MTHTKIYSSNEVRGYIENTNVVIKVDNTITENDHIITIDLPEIITSCIINGTISNILIDSRISYNSNLRLLEVEGLLIQLKENEYIEITKSISEDCVFINILKFNDKVFNCYKEDIGIVFPIIETEVTNDVHSDSKYPFKLEIKCRYDIDNECSYVVYTHYENEIFKMSHSLSTEVSLYETNKEFISTIIQKYFKYNILYRGQIYSIHSVSDNYITLTNLYNDNTEFIGYNVLLDDCIDIIPNESYIVFNNNLYYKNDIAYEKEFNNIITPVYYNSLIFKLLKTKHDINNYIHSNTKEDLINIKSDPVYLILVSRLFTIKEDIISNLTDVDMDILKIGLRYPHNISIKLDDIITIGDDL